MLKPGGGPVSLRLGTELNPSPVGDDGDADQDQAHVGRGLGQG